MSLPVRTLPIVERWDCHNCGICCRGTIIELQEDDVAKIRAQRWEERPEFREQKVVVRAGVGRSHLAKRSDGSCIFLKPDNRCLIHELHGFDAKPLICRLAPLQIVPLEQFAYLTLRRYCPSGAGAQGRPLDAYLTTARDLIEQWQSRPKRGDPLPINRRGPATWKQLLSVSDGLTRLMRDTQYPLIRRLVHGLVFCDHLERCRFDSEKLAGGRVIELVSLLERSVADEAKPLFRGRIAAGKRSGALFRQMAFEHLRLHPKFQPERSWRERWRLIKAAMAFSRGKGAVPELRLPFPPATFESLDRPLGALPEEVLQPLNEFFETAVASLRFATPGRPGWPLVESFRSLAVSYSIALWALRLACGARAPCPEDMVQVVIMLDRGLSYPLFVGRGHRFRVSAMAGREDLARLAVWYAR